MFCENYDLLEGRHSPSPTKPPSTSSPNNLLDHPTFSKLFQLRTLTILQTLYPKSCKCESPNIRFLHVKNRPTVGRCSNCHYQVSITAKTPFQNYKSNLAYISFIIWDMINQYPKVMTSKEISRKLNLSVKSSFYLKKRIQVIFSQLNESLREKLFKELENPEFAKDKIAVADSVVLYSSSLRANKYRS